MRRGPAPEALLSDTPFSARVPWRDEVEAARRARSDAEAASRDPKQLARLRAAARAELGAAGVPLLAEKMEKLRAEWTDDRMVELGKARAQALGWPDAYAYSKALGEWALLEGRGALPVTVVRPSIIEAALSQPHPGWIRGFRMADPVIISYARGLLKEFPGIPEGIIDVIPVDLVVAAILAVAARGPLEQPDVVHAASGARNPLRYGQLVDLVREWFSEHPLADDKGQPIEVPEWSFPGRRRVQNQLRQATKALRGAERALQALPLRGGKAELAGRIEERRDEAERALGYVELYGAYTETEAVFAVDRLLELKAQLSADEQDEFCFDPAVVEWPRFCHDVYLPAVVAHARVRQAGPRRQRSGPGGPDPPGTGAPGGALARPPAGRFRPGEHPGRHQRRRLLRLVRHPAHGHPRARPLHGAHPARGAPDALARHGRPGRLPALVLPPLRERRPGHAARGLLGADQRPAAGQVVPGRDPPGPRAPRPRPPDPAHHRCPRLRHRAVPPPVRRRRLRPHGPGRAGELSGEMVEAPPTGEARALIMADYAREHGLDLAECVAYADSTSDLPMLEAAGYPVAVNPETKLAALARKRGWLVEQWPRAAGYRRALLPLGPRVSQNQGSGGLRDI